MDQTFKWVGGATLGVAATLGLLAYSVTAGAEAGENAAASRPAPAAETAEQVDIPAQFTKAATEDFVVNSILPIEGPMKYGEWHWDEDRAPKSGRLVVTVDLEARVVSVFKGGHEIGAAVAMLGTNEHPTPLGTFPILTKERHNVSEKYGNAPMPWTLRLTWDGIAIHGGSVVENGYASHGCIAVPDGFADALFDVAQAGDLVVITRGKRIDPGAAARS